jgi:hypothetical protein
LNRRWIGLDGLLKRGLLIIQNLLFLYNLSLRERLEKDPDGLTWRPTGLGDCCCWCPGWYMAACG